MTSTFNDRGRIKVIDLELNMRVLNAPVTTLQGLRVELVLKNIDTDPVEIPSPIDRTDTLTFCLYDPKGKLLRSMNGLTGQSMMSGSRIDGRKEIGRLEGGQQWTWELDLCQFHYPLPAGQFFLSALYRLPREGIVLETPRLPVAVSPVPVSVISRTIDAPVMDRLHMLYSWKENGAQKHVLRNYNYHMPLACWYTIPLPGEVTGPAPLISAASHFQTSSFDPLFDCWIAWQEEGSVAAMPFAWGVGRGPKISAPLPSRNSVLRYAFHVRNDELYLIFEMDGGHIGCYRFSDRGLERKFSSEVPLEPGSRTVFHCTTDGLEIISAGKALTWTRLSLSGELAGSRELYRSRLTASHCWFNPVGKVAQTVYRDSAKGSSVDFVSADIFGSVVHHDQVDHLPLRGALREISFHFTRSGRLQFLVSTDSGGLYYGSNRYGIQLIETGSRTYFPHLIVSGRTYLGYCTETEGFRYRLYDRRHRGSHLVSFEEYQS